MPVVTVDYDQVVSEEISSQDAAGQQVAGEGYAVPVFIPIAEVSAWLAAYDPSNQYSPSATDSREIARVVLDALKKKVEG